jgi:uncharacterized protein YuzE
MRIKYDPEADVLILILREDPPADALEERTCQRRIFERIDSKNNPLR